MKDINNRYYGLVEKKWGNEDIWVSNDLYCSKFLNFNDESQFSMHFHREKHETWYVLSGKFIVEWIDTTNATQHSKELNTGDVWTNIPLLPHRLICVAKGSIIEVSTSDSIEDNYRILPGDSQL